MYHLIEAGVISNTGIEAKLDHYNLSCFPLKIDESAGKNMRGLQKVCGKSGIKSFCMCPKIYTKYLPLVHGKCIL